MTKWIQTLCAGLLFNGITTALASPSIAMQPEVTAQLQERLQAGHFPGAAVAIFKHGEPIQIGTFGAAVLAHDVPVTENTVFELASLTKHMTALAILTLVEEQQLALDDPISDFVDNTPAKWRQITIDQLLSHMGGLAHRFEQKVNSEFLLEYSAEDMLASAMKTPMQSDPGTDWHYSDQGYFLLGLVIEKVSGESFAEFMHKRFFGPLGMRQTHILDQRKIVPHLAQGYAWVEGELQRNRRVWQFGLISHFGVMSSLADMIKWEKALHSPTVISAEVIQKSWQITRAFDAGGSCDSWGYGRGWQVRLIKGKRIVTHGGHSGTAYWRSVDEGLSVLVLTNREDTEEALSPVTLAWQIASQYSQTISPKSYACWQ